jgi:hypothetical protein
MKPTTVIRQGIEDFLILVQDYFPAGREGFYFDKKYFCLISLSHNPHISNKCLFYLCEINVFYPEEVVTALEKTSHLLSNSRQAAEALLSLQKTFVPAAR